MKMLFIVFLLPIHLTIPRLVIMRFSRGSKHQKWNHIVAKRNLEKNKGQQVCLKRNKNPRLRKIKYM